MPENDNPTSVPATYAESASGTTNPDNANSGNAAYVIAAIAAVLLVGVCMAISSCATQIAASVEDYLDIPYGIDDDDEYDGLTEEEFQQMIIEYLNTREDTSGGSSIDTSSDEMSLAEALSQELALYGDTIDDGVSASDYAGVDAGTRTYVRSIVSLDGEATDEVVRRLRAAGREGEDAQAQVEAALEVARQAADDIGALEVPTSLSDDVAGQLEAARDASARRWEAACAELELLDADDEIDTHDLNEADEALLDATSEASDAVTEALLASAASR